MADPYYVVLPADVYDEAEKHGLLRDDGLYVYVRQERIPVTKQSTDIEDMAAPHKER
jgi:hypothetical protein